METPAGQHGDADRTAEVTSEPNLVDGKMEAGAPPPPAPVASRAVRKRWRAPARVRPIAADGDRIAFGVVTKAGSQVSARKLVWACSYTKQKRQKRKRWADGVLELTLPSRKAKVFAADDEGRIVRGRGPLDSRFLKGAEVEELSNSSLEFDYVLVEVAEPIDDGENGPASQCSQHRSADPAAGATVTLGGSAARSEAPRPKMSSNLSNKKELPVAKRRSFVPPKRAPFARSTLAPQPVNRFAPTSAAPQVPTDARSAVADGMDVSGIEFPVMFGDGVRSMAGSVAAESGAEAHEFGIPNTDTVPYLTPALLPASHETHQTMWSSEVSRTTWTSAEWVGSHASTTDQPSRSADDILAMFTRGAAHDPGPPRDSSTSSFSSGRTPRETNPCDSLPLASSRSPETTATTSEPILPAETAVEPTVAPGTELAVQNPTQKSAAPLQMGGEPGVAAPTSRRGMHRLVRSSRGGARHHESVALAPRAVLDGSGLICEACILASSQRRTSTAERSNSSSDTCPTCFWRRIRIPDCFSSLYEYRATMRKSIVQEMNMQIAELGSRYWSTVARTAAGCTRMLSLSAPQLSALRRSGVPAYDGCELIRTGGRFAQHRPSRGRKGWRSREKDADSDEEGEANPADVKPEAWYLCLSDTERSAAYAVGDLWVVSASPEFVSGGQAQRDFTFIATALWHGPSSRNWLALGPLPGQKFPDLGNKRTLRVVALRGSNARTQLAMLETVHKMTAANAPLVPVLLRGDLTALAAEDDQSGKAGHESSSGAGSTTLGGERPKFKLPRRGPVASYAGKHMWQRLKLTTESISSCSAAVIAEFHLNDEQAAVVQRCASWFEAAIEGCPEAACPIQLVHGVFGAGKSHLLVAALSLLQRLIDEGEPSDVKDPIRVLVAGATNVAVDRVLLGLREAGCTSIARAGSVRRIAKLLLPRTLPYEHSERAVGQTISDLESVLPMVDGEEEQSAVAAALEKMRRANSHVSELKTSRIFGVTCSATGFPILSDLSFPIVVLDEASQMVEPMSLLPIARFGCQRLLCVGDPLQLPPTLASAPPSVAKALSTHNCGAAAGGSLERTLFERLVPLQVPTVKLVRQYRCHPAISAVSSELFYNGELKDGIKSWARGAIIRGVAPIVFFDVKSPRESTDASGSWRNESEARVVIQLVSELLSRSVSAERIAVICLYRAQANDVQRRLKARARAGTDRGLDGQPNGKAMSKVEVATVDAFQGAERDVVVVSCVRSSTSTFLDDAKRINVALTRAKRHLLVVGNRDALSGTRIWSRVLSHAGKLPGGIRPSHGNPLLFAATLKPTVQSSESDGEPARGLDAGHGAISIAADDVPRSMNSVADSAGGEEELQDAEDS